MFLQVVNLSAIMTADGKKISEQAWNGKQDDNRVNDYQWPRAPKKLSKLHWQIWRKALQATFVDPMKTNKHELLMRLHDWNLDITKKWTWFYSLEDDMLYKREGLLWYSYTPTNDARRHNGFYDCNPNAIREIPVEILHVATVTEKDGMVELIASSSDNGPARSRLHSIPATSLTQLRHQEPKSNKWAIADWDYTLKRICSN